MGGDGRGRVRAAISARRQSALVVAAASAALTVALWWRAVGVTPMWRDEAATLLFAGLSPSQLWAATAHTDRSMFPYYLLAGFWAAGAADPLVALRALSVAGFAATAGFGSVVAHRLWGTPAALVAGGFLAVNRPLALLSLQARSYSLCLAAFALATLALVLLARAPSGRPALRVAWTALYAASLTTAVALNVLVVAAAAAAHVAFLLASPALRRRPRSALVGWAVAGVAGTASVWLSRGQTGQLSWVPPASPGRFLDACSQVLLASGQGLQFAGLALASSAVALVWLLARRRLRPLDPGLVLAASLAAGPLLVLTVASVVLFPVLEARYAIGGTLGASLLVACGFGLALREARGRAWWAVAAWAALLGVVAVASAARTQIPVVRDGSVQVAATLRASAMPGDRIRIHQIGAATGTVGALAAALNDQSLWRQAVDLLRAGPAGDVDSRVVSVTPWQTEPWSPVAGPATPTGRMHLVGLVPPPEQPAAFCRAIVADRAADLVHTLYDCG